ncbi:MAG: GIY-YIG nuclease family protein [Oxalobacteraceae bacterium]|nr:MAG: GIY-YIG nuclease family protein [Oxalobacteraceae bacterium]
MAPARRFRPAPRTCSSRSARRSPRDEPLPVRAELVEAVKPFYAYLLRCGDGSYYAGHTDDVEARMQQHQAGEQGYTSTRKPVELVWQGEFETREGALAFEQPGNRRKWALFKPIQCSMMS